MSLLFQRGSEKRVGSLASLEQILLQEGRRPRSSRTTPAVTADTSLTLSAVWACIRILCDNVAGLPVDAYQRKAKSRVELDEQPPIVASPSAIVSRSTWIYQQMASMCFRGNGYGIHTQFGADGWPTKTEIVHPDTMRVQQLDQLAPPDYFYMNKPIPRERVYHVSAWNIPGSVVGLSPLSYAASSVGIGLSAADYASDVMSGKGHPTVVLESDQVLDGDTARDAKDRLLEVTSDGSHVAVLGAGLKLNQLQLSPAEMLWLDTQNAVGLDACRYFGVPSTMAEVAMSTGSLSYANREDRAIDFVIFTLQWWITRIEEAWSALLPKAQYVKLNTGALLRTSQLTQAQVMQIQLNNGLLNPDEGRALTDRTPLPDGQGQLFMWPPRQPILIGGTNGN